LARRSLRARVPPLRATPSLRATASLRPATRRAGRPAFAPAGGARPTAAVVLGHGAEATERERAPSRSWGLSSCEIGGDLLSRGVSTQVPSAQAGLTSVFGMGT